MSAMNTSHTNSMHHAMANVEPEFKEHVTEEKGSNKANPSKSIERHDTQSKGSKEQNNFKEITFDVGTFFFSNLFVRRKIFNNSDFTIQKTIEDHKETIEKYRSDKDVSNGKYEIL
jgi:hypothetical protein